MSATRPTEILRRLEPVAVPDGELLARFAAHRDQSAFAELVRRHGGGVLGVCQRVTRSRADAEDAFQAVFLVLAKKADAVRDTKALSSWLYGVAYRVALRSRQAAGRRRAWEVTMPILPDCAGPDPNLGSASDLAAALDRELAALPSHYRDAIVLCDLQGASREDAAVVLGVPEGTLSSRLANGRKRLAARLTKRGVALSVAVLPLALADVRAAAVVPKELISHTGRLAADIAAGGAVPCALSYLLSGGSPVRKMLVVSAVLAVVVTGAVFAARSNAEPLQKEPPEPFPVSVVRTVDPPKPKDELRPGKSAFAAPKLRRSSDLPTFQAFTALWNPTGTRLAVKGLARLSEDANKYQSSIWVIDSETGEKGSSDMRPDFGADLVDVTPDGWVVTDLRENNLISGNHRLDIWGNGFVIAKSVDVETGESHGYAFSADRKTYRTIIYHREGDAVKQIEVLEVNATSGKISKSCLKIDWGMHALSANGKRLAVIDGERTRVTVHDVDSGAKVSEHKFQPDAPVELLGGMSAELPRKLAEQMDQEMSLMLSADGRRLLVARGVGRTIVLNTDTGEALPKLDGISTGWVHANVQAFTTDGRLLAARVQQYEAQADLSGGVGFDGTRRPSVNFRRTSNVVLNVWDTHTGKVLKTWKASDGVRAMFSPTSPRLAVLEPNGQDRTRVGFWEFKS